MAPLFRASTASNAQATNFGACVDVQVWAAGAGLRQRVQAEHHLLGDVGVHLKAIRDSEIP